MNGEQPDVHSILRRYGIRPQKKLGQNFLIEMPALRRVVDAAEIHPSDHVMEIGAGIGNLTTLLAQNAARVVAIELDSRLIPVLNAVLEPYQNITIVQGDILELNTRTLMEQPGYQVVANIPYYITSALIRHLIESEPKPKHMTLTIQKEVGERICATPGAMSLLALSVQVYGKPHIAGKIPASAFYPEPKVDSAIVCIDIYASPLIPQPMLPIFFRLAKAGFSQKRKNLRNAISAGMHWSKDYTEEILTFIDIDPKRRAQTLSLEEWGNLAKAVNEQAKR